MSTIYPIFFSTTGCIMITYIEMNTQPLYVPTGILMASYFGCRLVSMFDAGFKFEEDDATNNQSSVPRSPVAEDHNDDSTEDISDDTDWDEDQSTIVNSRNDPDDDEDVSTCITFVIAPHQIPGEPNALFAKVTITHTKGEDNCPRETAPPCSICICHAMANLAR